jgi:hypothetical protein
MRAGLPALLLCACTAAFRPQADPYVDSLREEYRAILRAQSILVWYSAVEGRREPLVVGRDGLFSKSALDAIDRAQAQSPADALALKFLRRSLTARIVALSVAKLDDEYADAEADATVTLPWRGAPVSYRDVASLIAQEPDAARRQEAYAAQTRIIESKLNPILLRREEAAKKAALETGFADYAALSEDLRSVQLGPLLASGVAYLEATQGVFPPLLDRVAREELGIARQDLRAADLPRLWKAPHLARYFDKSLELKALANFLQGIGLDLRTAAGTEVRIDDSLRPRKRPRAFVEAVDAPADVRMSVKPVGGLDDYWTLFHEAGHAVHFASATIEPKELVTLGNGTPSEAFGEFFRGAYSDPHWLVRYRTFLVGEGKPAPSNAELAAVLRRTALVEMLYLRRYAFAKVAYELCLHGRPAGEIAPALRLLSHPDKAAADPRELYRELLSAAYSFELNDEESQRYLTDVDDTFYSADYSRAFVLAGMMHDAIERRFGSDWYGNREVGKFLKTELFAPGTSLSPEEVAQRLGFSPRLDFDEAAARATRLVAEADALEKAK